MVAGISMVRDEADIVGSVVEHMLGQVDLVIVADNGSVDGTRELLEGLDVELRDDPDPAYYQSSKMSRLAAEAADAGADWVVPFDADEWWYSPFGRISDVLSEFNEAIAPAALYNHLATGADDLGDPTVCMGWRMREAGELPKVACRPRPAVRIHQGNHGADYGDTVADQLVVRHFPYRSAEQMIRKARNGAAAYAATDLPEHEGAHWRAYGRLSDEQIADAFRTHFWVADPTGRSDLILDPCPR